MRALESFRQGLAAWLLKGAPSGQLARVDSSRGWWPIIREPSTGAWQAGLEQSQESLVNFHALFACVSLIASDVAKMRLRLMHQDPDGVWSEADNPAFSPVLRRPNHYQNRIQFVFRWLVSKLLHGNTYALKRRDARNVVNALYILDPARVCTLVAPDGSVYYELKPDNLAEREDTIVVPAREIIHDVCVPLFHPLVGVSPMTACSMAAGQGLQIQRNSARFFEQGSQPGGVLTAPGTINQETATRVKDYWDQNFTGPNVGKVAVLGDGLKYEAMSVNAVDAQLVEQLKMAAEAVCSAFHVPAFMVGVGAPPTYNNIEALNQQYYSQCLQVHIEALELLLDEGLELPARYATEFDVEDLLRMDSATKMKTATMGVGGGVLTPNEARRRFDLRPVPGGNSVYLQQQYYSLEALDRRDQAAPAPPTPPAAVPAAEPEPEPGGAS